MTGRRWNVVTAGVPCSIELGTGQGRQWTVIVAGACISRRDELRAALIDASGGAVSPQELDAIVAEIRTELKRSAGRPHGDARARHSE